jgi:hypothetical protein
VLGPPIEAGDRYVAADGCCESERHVRAALGIGDQQWIAQRFAIDWEQLDAGDRFLQGDPEDPEDYTVYGQQALAATDGEVVLVIDGLEEQVPGELPGMALPLDQADGNSVVIRIGDGLYLSYAHMQAGSITVAEGEEVERGAVIGLVGNSGNSSAPHLHVHLMDGPSPLASSGLPYVIESFETTGAIPSTELFDRIENTADRVPLKPAPGEGENADELPLDQTIVNFP